MEFIKKLVFGFATGMGFSIAFVLIVFVSMDYLIDDAYEDAMSATEDQMDWKYSAEDGSLIISNEKSEIDETGIFVTGVLINEGDRDWSGIQLELELFDDSGDFVHECSEYISRSLAPGQKENFKVSCKGCKETKLPEFKTYKLAVVSASGF